MWSDKIFILLFLFSPVSTGKTEIDILPPVLPDGLEDVVEKKQGTGKPKRSRVKFEKEDSDIQKIIKEIGELKEKQIEEEKELKEELKSFDSGLPEKKPGFFSRWVKALTAKKDIGILGEKSVEEEPKKIESKLSERKVGLFSKWMNIIKERREKKAAESEIKKAIDSLKKKEPALQIISEKKIEQPFEIGPEPAKKKVKPPKRKKIESTEGEKIEPLKEEPALDNLDEIQKKLIDARSALVDLKLDEAKKIYIEIIKLYNPLSPKEKVVVYQDILDLYDDRKAAESLVIK